jgi:prepilin-type N-terminal cleavage/methylation domain-containing protein
MVLHLNNRKGFTLIEMLVVITLLGIVMGLIFGPLIQGSWFVRNGQMMVRAQESSRTAMSQVSQDLSEAMFVYDTSGSISCPMLTQDGTATWVDPTQGNYSQMRNAKIDMILPRMQGYCTASNAMHDPQNLGRQRAFSRNYTYVDSNGKLQTDANLVEAAPRCPYDGTLLQLRPVQPLTADTTVVRYFIGLRDNTVIGKTDGKVHYANRYLPAPQNKSVATSDGRSVDRNMYVLYRVEFNPTDSTLFPPTLSNGQTRSALDNINDPNFFYNTDEIPSSANPTSEGERYCDAWNKICRVVASPDDMDLVTFTYDANGNPVVTPTVQFTPTVVNDDRLVPITNTNGDPENSAAVPVAYRGSYGNWTSPYQITVYRNGQKAFYTESATDPSTNVTSLWIYNVGSSGNSDTQVFNITKYQNLSLGPDTNYDASWTGYKYGFGEIDSGQQNVPPQLAFTLDLKKGAVNFAFPHVDVTTSDALSSVLGGGTPVSFGVDTKALNDYYTCQATPPGTSSAVPYSWLDSRRFVEFNLSGPNATLSYTCPQLQVGMAAPLTVQYENGGNSPTWFQCTQPWQFLQNSTVVYGLEKVIAPDANVGQSYGMPVQYNRVPFMNLFAEPSVNQYKIDVQHPVMGVLSSGGSPGAISSISGAAALYFRSDRNQTGPSYRLPQYDPNNPTNPQNSDLLHSMPGGASPIDGTINYVYALYYEQNNQLGDVVKASYVTKSVMTVNLGIRLYDSTNGRPYLLQLTSKMKLKNAGT